MSEDNHKTNKCDARWYACHCESCIMPDHSPKFIRTYPWYIDEVEREAFEPSDEDELTDDLGTPEDEYFEPDEEDNHCVKKSRSL